MPWYDGPDAARAPRDGRDRGDRTPHDRALPGAVGDPADRADEHHDYRGYAGQVAGGVWRAGDEVVVLPGGPAHAGRRGRDARRRARRGASRRSRSRSASRTTSTSARGDMLADPERDRRSSRASCTRRALLDERAAARAGRALAGQADDRAARGGRRGARCPSSTCTRWRTARRPRELELNDLGVVRLRLAEPLVVDPYARNRAHRRFILIDEATNETVAAGMIKTVASLTARRCTLSFLPDVREGADRQPRRDRGAHRARARGARRRERGRLLRARPRRAARRARRRGVQPRRRTRGRQLPERREDPRRRHGAPARRRSTPATASSPRTRRSRRPARTPASCSSARRRARSRRWAQRRARAS